MKKIALLLVMLMLFTSVPVFAEDAELSSDVFDYSQDFSGGKPDDDIFYIVTGFCDVNNGALRTKMNWTGGWSDLKVESSQIKGNNMYAEVTANILGDLSFRMSTESSDGAENSYIEFDGTDGIVKTANGRKLVKFSTGNNKIGININYANKTADIYLGGSPIALGIDWDASDIKAVHYRWHRLTGTSDIRPTIDNVIVTCNAEKLKGDVTPNEYVTDTHTDVDGTFKKTQGYAYISNSKLTMKLDANAEYGFAYGFENKTTPYVYAKFKADILANTVLKFGIKNTYDTSSNDYAPTFTDKICIARTPATNNITKDDGTVIGSYDVSAKGGSPTVELLIDQNAQKCTLWITGSDSVRTFISKDIPFAAGNVSKLYVGWASSADNIRPSIGAVTFCGSKKYLPTLSYTQDFQCAEMPSDGVISLVDYSYLDGGVLRSKVKSSDNVGVLLNKNAVIPDDMYLSVKATFKHSVSFKLTSVSGGTESAFVTFSGDDGKIYDADSKVIGTFDNSKPEVARKIEFYSLGGKGALVVDGKLISSEISSDAKSADSVGLKWSNTTTADLRPSIDDIALTEKNSEIPDYHLVTDPYIDGAKVKIGMLNNDEAKILIIAKYNDNEISSVEPKEINANAGIETLSYDYDGGKVFLWNNMTEIRPLAIAIGE